MNDDQLINKYRPNLLEEVYGHDAVVKSLEGHLAAKVPPHNYLFAGEPGVGKTTLANIMMNQLGCNDRVIRDAALISGVDAMRDLIDLLRMPPLLLGVLVASGVKRPARRAILIDECHGLSKQAWDSLLMTLEQPAPHNYFFFSTTLISKVPKAIRQRCAEYQLKLVAPKQIAKMLDDIADAEKFQAPNEVIDLCVELANGSPRQAIANLSKVGNFTKLADAQELLGNSAETTEAVEIARLITKGSGWGPLVKAAAKVDPSQIDNVRYITVNYLSKVVLGNGKPDLMKALRAFSKPFAPNEGLAPLLLAIEEATKR